MSIYKSNFYKTRCIYFAVKDQKFLQNVMKFGKMLAISSKKYIYICAHNKKYLKAEKNQQKRRLSV